MKRTSKTFTNYNAYRDRPFGLKWGTAFAMEELVTAIHQATYQFYDDQTLPPPMTEMALNHQLKRAYLKHNPLTVFLNQKDVFGSYLPPITGYFYGESTLEWFVVSGVRIAFGDVRAIEINRPQKWSQITEESD